MENNQLQKLDKKSFIKKELKKIIGLVILVLIGVYIQQFEYLSIKIIIVALAFIISFMLSYSFLSFKYPDLHDMRNHTMFSLMLGHDKFLEYGYGPVVNYFLGRPMNYTKAKSWLKRQFLTDLVIVNLFALPLFFALYIFFEMPIHISILVFLIASNCFIIWASISDNW